MAGTNNINVGTGSGGIGTATAYLRVDANTDQQIATIYDAEMFNANSPVMIQSLALASGANTINATTCPALANAGGVILIPPAGNTIAITLKGVTGDTGLTLSLTAPALLPFPVSPQSSFVITAANIIAGFRLLFF